MGSGLRSLALAASLALPAAGSAQQCSVEGDRSPGLVSALLTDAIQRKPRLAALIDSLERQGRMMVVSTQLEHRRESVGILSTALMVRFDDDSASGDTTRYFIDGNRDGYLDVAILVPGPFYAGLDTLVAQRLGAGPDGAVQTTLAFKNWQEYWSGPVRAIDRSSGRLLDPAQFSSAGTCLTAATLRAAAKIYAPK